MGTDIYKNNSPCQSNKKVKDMIRGLVFFIFLCTTLCAGTPPLLKKSDIRPTMEELFSYHIESRELTPVVVKRSFKSLIEQFDPQKMYLLYSEVKPFLELTSTDIESAIDHYSSDEYPDYENLTRLFAKATARAQSLRKQIAAELFAQDNMAAKVDPGYQYAADEAQLKERIRGQFVRVLENERAANADPAYWTLERKQKVVALIEKMFQRFEATYAGGPKEEHYFAMHLLKALARSLDAHTAYFSPQEAFEMRTALEKQFEGVGVVLKEGVDGVQISDLIKGGPAERSGKIEVGDLLVEIDGKSVTQAPYEEVLERLKGQGKKDINLGLKREDTVVRVTLQREKILMQDDRLTYTAEPFADGFIGKLTLPSFYESFDAPSCETDIREALKDLKRRGKLYGLVLDMRENLGGFLSQAVKVAGLFITSGVVVISKYAQGEVQYMRNVDPRVYFNGPLVILTSKASASAAEIVAQALQDYGVGLVVGDKTTYGKGTIQYQTVTDDDATTFFKVTVGRYYTVSGRSTQIDGVQADLVVPSQFAPYSIGERFLEYPLSSDRIAAAYNDNLVDVDGQTKLWFQRNYLPNIQKKESAWRKMLPALEKNSAYRIQHDPNFKLYIEQIKPIAEGSSAKVNWGNDDLQMMEAVNIVKDMISLEQKKPS
ncbi:MAG: PDZ domain-containing protein [Verrucomicrobia bacterium]|nr:PDZ domain-containing protein [Verrucomicrobiota bacterium]